VQPRAKQTALAERIGDAYKLRLAAPPVDGKANEANMRMGLSAICLFAGPAALFAGSIVQTVIPLTGTNGQVATVASNSVVFGGSLLIGSDHCVGVTCTLSGAFSFLGASISWSVTSPNGGVSGFTYSENPVPPVFSISGGPGTFSVNETNLGMDSLSGSFTLTSLTESGSPLTNNMTIAGAATVTGFSVVPGDPFTLALASAGITGTGSIPLSVTVSNCLNNTVSSPCVINQAVTTSLQSVDPAGMVTLVTIGSQSGVPEPGTIGLVAVGLAGLAWRRRRLKRL
jgi:hypothetical protein